MRRVSLLLLVVLLSLTEPLYADVPALNIGGFEADFSPFTLVRLPGEPLAVRPQPGQEGEFSIRLNGEQQVLGEGGGWQSPAPEQPGLYEIVASVGDRDMRINVFVTVPSDRIESQRLNGYRIGEAPPVNDRHPGLYEPPRGYIEVTEDLLSTQMTPHFQLHQFLCKQESDYPKYVVVQESLLMLLEGLVQAVREAGHPVETFGVISAYRTPWYNKKIGNVKNSRHVYGDAMDFYIDVDRNGRMDDLDDDGDEDLDDVLRLFDIVTDFVEAPGNAQFTGGVGRYGKTSRHGGFVHVDTRGYTARW